MKLQVALDRMTISEAIDMGRQVEEHVDWIEVGTSLIKEFGMESIRKMKEAFPNKVILADMKTMDNALYEFEKCFENGADAATVMGVSPEATIDACIKVAEKYHKIVMIDLLNTSDEQKATAAAKNAVLCAHISKDQQELLKGDQSFSVHSVLEDRRLAFAGGIQLETISSVREMKPEVIIVGSAITKAKSPAEAARKFRKSFESEERCMLTKEIIKEIESVVNQVDEVQLKTAGEKLKLASRIFVIGEGRSGLMAKSFAMRLMHLGAEVFVVGETITPSIEKDDLLIAVSGSGKTKQVVWTAGKARDLGCEVIAVTTNLESELGQQASNCLLVPAATKYRKEGEAESIQPLGSLFDQSVHILFDTICLIFSGSDGSSQQNAFKRHSNLE